MAKDPQKFRKDPEEKRATDQQRIQGLRLLDDDFMSKVFEDTECAQLLLQIILERPDLRVQKVSSQHTIKNLQGRSVRLDILAVDEEGRICNIEVQRSDRGAVQKRARYNASLLDANVTEPGDTYENLAETYVIFITEHDVLGAGLPIYHIERMIRETNTPFGDETHILYVNAEIQDETQLGRLMHDFTCISAREMHYPVLARRVIDFKVEEKGGTNVGSVFEEVRYEEKIDTLLDTAENLMKNLGLTAEQALDAMGVSEEDREIMRDYL